MYKYLPIKLTLGFLLIFGVSQAATIQVNADAPEQLEDGLCSIAEAVIAANTDQAVDGCSAGNGADTILLENQSYILKKADNLTNGPNGLPAIRSEITIQGTLSNENFFENPQAATRIERDTHNAIIPPLPYTDGKPPMRLFYVMEEATLSLKNLFLSGGFTGANETFFNFEERNSLQNKGGAIFNLGTLNLQHVKLQNNHAVGSGGAIYSVGNLVIKDARIIRNHAELFGGGAIDAQGSLMIQRTFLVQNSAELGGAIRFVSSPGQVGNKFVSVNSMIADNRAFRGGAIYMDSGIVSRFLHTTITDNVAHTFDINVTGASGGGLFIEGVKDNTNHQPQVMLGNTIIANNTGNDCLFETAVNLDATGNWFGDNTCNKHADGNSAMFNPKFFTVFNPAFYSNLSSQDDLIPAHSPLIDAATDLICSDPLVGDKDMLGNQRKLDGDGLNGAQCEIGAVERQRSSEHTAFEDNRTFSFNDAPLFRRNEFGGFNLLETIDVNHQWAHFRFDHQDYDQYASLVFLSPPGIQGFQTGVIRLNSRLNTVDGCCTMAGGTIPRINLDDGGLFPPPPKRTEFDMRFQELTYLDQFHLNEQVSILGARAGIQRSENGEVIVLSDFELSGTGQWTTVRTPKMGGIPHVFLTAQTVNGGQPVSVRVRNVTESSFEAALFEEEALMQSGHVSERIAYLLIYSPEQQGKLQLPDRQVSYQLKQIELDHQWQQVFDVEIKLQEDQSRDSELFHLKERVDVIKIGEHVFAQQVSSRGGDPAVLRLR